MYWQILYAKRKGLTDVVLNSNGNLLNEEACLGLIESGLDAIYIGIDAFKSETYEKLRVGGNYNRVVANVNNLLRLKKELGVLKLEVFVQFVEMDANQSEVKDFTEYWNAQGAKAKVRPKVTWAGTVAPWRVKEIKRYPCYWVMRTMVVGWDGRVVLCGVDYDAKFVAGDVNNNSMQSVWEGSLKEIRDMQSQGKYELLPTFCKGCTDWQMARAEYSD
jgi:radical SAM protein with 4Fe4S-binding SPASM domain